MIFFFIFDVASRVTTLFRHGRRYDACSIYRLTWFNFQQIRRIIFPISGDSRKIINSSVIYNFHRKDVHRRYNTKIHQHSFARREHKRNRKHRVDSFPAKREPRVLSERGIVQRARDNRGRPFRKFDGMRSPSAKRRHPGETFYRRCCYPWLMETQSRFIWKSVYDIRVINFVER